MCVLLVQHLVQHTPYSVEHLITTSKTDSKEHRHKAVLDGVRMYNACFLKMRKKRASLPLAFDQQCIYR